MSNLRSLILTGGIQIKADSDRTFEAYGNVKNVEDKVGDVAVDGCYKSSIESHRKAGTSPRLLWSHDPYSLPLGKIMHMEEDRHGLLFRGKLSTTSMGNDVYALAKDNALDSFSIGYNVHKERRNNKGQNELIEIDVKEISFVNFACNEHSLLQSIKSELAGGKLPSKRELQTILRDIGMSKKQAELIANNYNPEIKTGGIDINLLKGNPLFN